MRFLRIVLFLALALLAVPLRAQDQPSRDQRALAVMQQSFVAMGGTVPTDAVVEGSITTTAGSATEQGTVRILTRGHDQTFEQIETRTEQSVLVFSRGQAGVKEGSGRKPLNLEQSSTSFSPNFPLIVIAAVLTNPEAAVEYVGAEKLGEISVHHIRFWNAYTSRPKLQHLAEFSRKDFWIDASTALPLKLAYEWREAGGAPRAQVEVTYSHYRAVQGILYPIRVERSFNGTPWAVITAESVRFNTGQPSDADFQVR